MTYVKEVTCKNNRKRSMLFESTVFKVAEVDRETLDYKSPPSISIGIGLEGRNIEKTIISYTTDISVESIIFRSCRDGKGI